MSKCWQDRQDGSVLKRVDVNDGFKICKGQPHHLLSHKPITALPKNPQPSSVHFGQHDTFTFSRKFQPLVLHVVCVNKQHRRRRRSWKRHLHMKAVVRRPSDTGNGTDSRADLENRTENNNRTTHNGASRFQSDRLNCMGSKKNHRRINEPPNYSNYKLTIRINAILAYFLHLNKRKRLQFIKKLPTKELPHLLNQ